MITRKFPPVLIKRLIVLVVIGWISTSARAQFPDPAARPDRGTRPVGSYSLSDIESINLQNGNVSLSIPLAALPPIAGGKLSFNVAAHYNSKNWDVKSYENEPDSFHQNNFWTAQQIDSSNSGGWRIGGAYGILQRLAEDDFTPADPGCTGGLACLEKSYHVKMFLVTPDGSQHELRPLDYQSQVSQNFRIGYYKDTPATVQDKVRYYSFDGSFIWARIDPYQGAPISWDVYLRDGTHIRQKPGGAQLITDTNGNQIKIFSEPNADGSVTTHYQDLVAVSPGIREIQVEDPGINGGPVQVIYQNVADGQGNPTLETIDIMLGTTNVTQLYNVGDHSCTDVMAIIGDDVPVIRSITFPQTETSQPRKLFSFSYNSDAPQDTINLNWRGSCGGGTSPQATVSHGWGSLSQMTTPDGAVINYSYLLDGDSSPARILGGAKRVAGETITQKQIKQDEIIQGTYFYSISSSPNSDTSSVTGPDGSVTTENFYPHDPSLAGSIGGSDGRGGLVYKTNNSNKKTIERHWISKIFDGGFAATPNGSAPFNAVVDAEYTTLMDANGAPSKMSAKTMQYDFNGNLTSETDYDWFDPASVTRDPNNKNLPTGVPAGAVALRTITNSYYNAALGSSSINYAKRDLTLITPLIVNAIKETTIGASDTQLSYDNQSFGTAPTVGNLTKAARWDNRGNKFLETTQTYDSYGNRLTTTQPGSAAPFVNTTTFTYDTSTHAQPVTITVDPLNGTGSQTATVTYDYYTGLITRQTDANNNSTDISYVNPLLSAVDPFGRPCVVTAPAVTSTVDGVTYTNQRHQTITNYLDNARQVETISDLRQQADGLLKSRTSSDRLGRPTLVETSENGSTYSIKTRSAYQQMGKITFSSNPTRDSGEGTDGWARTTRDDVGRVVEVAMFSGAAQPPSTGTNSNWTGSIATAYNAEQTTFTDQAGKKRRSFVDGEGRLKQVDELFENGTLYSSSFYSYDVLNNLTLVQQGVQQRQFTYDTLSRLRESYNPEQQMVATVYQYDDASNLTRRTNPSGTYVDFAYDGLNRTKTKTLSTGGVWNYNYDSGTNFKGRLLSVKQASGDGNYYDSYDAVGKLTTGRQITDGNSYSLSYGYDLVGNMTSETYPSGKVVRTSYDTAGRVGGVSRYISGVLDKTYASFSYCACGATMSATLGNGLKEQTNFNSRLQPSMIELRRVSTNELILGLDYTYSPSGTITNNNGNLLTQTIRIGGTTVPTTTFSQSYVYDQVNRLSSASESGSWSQNYGYDQYGNRWVSASSNFALDPDLCPTQQSQIDAMTNRINKLVMTGFDYDANGNQNKQRRAGQNETQAYDADNRMTNFNGGLGQYFYDGDGRRVKKIDATGTAIFVYNTAGQLIAEYTSGSPSGSGTSYLTGDHLQSTRVVTSAADGSGNVTVKARFDYLPFGEEIPSSLGGRSSVVGYVTTDKTRQKFTEKERDSESGMDYFLTRYHSPAQGRFTSPDTPLVGQHPTYPQSWNLYAYVRNNPCSLIDPNGQDCVYATDNGEGVESIDHNSSSGECGDTGGTWVPGNVKESNVNYNKGTEMFQVASNDGQNVYYSLFGSGARTREDGTCVTGCDGFDIQHANAAWLSSMLVGGNLDEMMHFMVARVNPIHGIWFKNAFGAFMERLLSGGLNPADNNWAGPSGMGPPHGASDWSAMVHDYNFDVNDIQIKSYFNPSLKKETAKALIQSNNSLIRNARGIQKLKFGLVFGIINAFQSFVQAVK